MKKILIVSQSNDQAAFLVSRYLKQENANVVILNSGSNLSYLLAHNIKDLINDVSAIWLRRSNLPQFNSNSTDLNLEKSVLYNYLHFLLENHKICLGNLRIDYNHNKLIDLELAEKIGLRIPYTKIFNSTTDVINFINSKLDSVFITKALSNSNVIRVNGIQYIAGNPSIISIKDLKEGIDLFPSLIQEYIDKRYEIRSFYLSGFFFSMAIFSQNDPKTRIDYRNYNLEKPNRNVPYKLPSSVEEKLYKLFQLKKLNTGSIDLIRATNGEYYFLEINPSGQFGWLSENCNYNIERRISDFLLGKQL